MSTSTNQLVEEAFDQDTMNVEDEMIVALILVPQPGSYQEDGTPQSGGYNLLLKGGSMQHRPAFVEAAKVRIDACRRPLLHFRGWLPLGS
jgi:hypothetical protein